jgi:hypothetical protein
MWVAADRAFMLTSKVNVITALPAAEPLHCSYSPPNAAPTEARTVFRETNFAEPNLS